MRPLILKKKYVGKEKIVSFKDVVLEDHFDSEINNNDLHIVGKVLLKGTIVYSLNEESYNDYFNVDIIIPSVECDNVASLQIESDNFQYEIKENVISFTLIISLKEEERLIKEDDLDKYMDDDNNLILSNDISEEVLDKEYYKQIEELMKNNDVEVFSSLDNKIVEESEENEESSIKDNDYIDIELDGNNEIIKEEPLQINKVNEEIMEEENNLDKNKYESLVKDTFIKSFFFYRVTSNDSKQSILDKFNMDEKEFDRYNQNKQIKEGTLVEVRKNEG
ncbi:MAG: hypothetical protein PUA56_00355 [Bacillales bacterium]|nr:hypothetical protein [Bacillales bacterium]